MKRNKNFKVFLLIISCFAIYFISSVIALLVDIEWEPFDNINLVSEVIKDEEPIDSLAIDLLNKELIAIVTIPTSVTKFELYHKPHLITNFKTHPTEPILLHFMQKLDTLKNSKKGTIRIAYFGDSMIEGDLLTQKLRELLQDKFGGEGVGFVPIYSAVYGFRSTAIVKGHDWEELNFATNKSKDIFISGYTFTGEGESNIRDYTISNTDVVLEKSLLYGKTEDAKVVYNGTNIDLVGDETVNRKLLSKDARQHLNFKSKTASLPVYGITIESENGVFVDNFPFRSVTGSQLGQISEEMLKAVDKQRHYDLIVFQYGVNLMFRSKDTNYDYYADYMTPIFKRFKNTFPTTDFLVIGSADRSFKYKGEFRTAIGLPNLIKTQAKLAYDNGFAFYNQYESMGGYNSMVKWVNNKPKLANKDHIHPNKKGTNKLAEWIFKAMLKDYELLNLSKNAKN